VYRLVRAGTSFLYTSIGDVGHGRGHELGELANDRLFEVTTPLGFSVRTTVDHWSLIEAKHPKLRGCAQDVAQVIAAPDQVCRSRLDSAVYLFYGAHERRLLCAVVKRLDEGGFLVTAYPCDKIKEGELTWPR
jgi:hypothetical protein